PARGGPPGGRAAGPAARAGAAAAWGGGAGRGRPAACGDLFVTDGRAKGRPPFRERETKKAAVPKDAALFELHSNARNYLRMCFMKIASVFCAAASARRAASSTRPAAASARAAADSARCAAVSARCAAVIASGDSLCAQPIVMVDTSSSATAPPASFLVTFR